MHRSLKHGNIRHFADDTNLLLVDKSLNRKNKRVNHNLRLLSEWLRANRLLLNSGKTEIVIFKPKTKEISKTLNFRVSGQKIKPKNSVKYLGLLLQDDLSWDTHINTLLKKLNRAIAILSKIRHYTPKWLLRTIYYSIFNSHMIYGCQIWALRHTSLVTKITKLQEKAMRIINFQPPETNTNTFFKETKILKFEDFLKYRTIKFVKETIDQHGPKSFRNFFTLAQNVHNHHTRGATNNLIDMPQTNTSL